MIKILLTLGFGLLVAGAAFAGGGDFNDMPQQQMSGKIIVNVDTPPRDNTALYVAAAVGAGGVIIAALIGARKRKG